MPTLIELVQTALLGLAAGVIGGLAGIGGSLVMLPGLHLLFGDDPASKHHLYMAAAMTVNVAVAAPAAVQHSRAGAVRRELLPTLLATSIAGVITGVLVSNLIDGEALKLLLAGFVIVYCVYLLIRVIRRVDEPEGGAGENVQTWRLMLSGGMAGLVGGLLGLGGGVVLVPFLQMVCGVRLRQAIATSTVVISSTALIGASIKLATLGQHGQSFMHALVFAGLMAPTAMIGGRLGAKLTHRLPLQAVRLAIVCLLLASAAKLLGAF